MVSIFKHVQSPVLDDVEDPQRLSDQSVMVPLYFSRTSSSTESLSDPINDPIAEKDITSVMIMATFASA